MESNEKVENYLKRIGYDPENKNPIIMVPVAKPLVSTNTSDKLLSAILTPEKSILSLRECAIKLTAGGRPNTGKIIKHGTQISVLMSIHSKENIVKVMGILIANFCGNFNVIRPMGPEQMADLAFDFVEEYWHLKLEDFVAFFHLAKKSNYGRGVMDRIDGGLIMEWFKEYLRAREEDIVMINPSYQYEQPREARPEDAVNRTLATVSTIKDYAKAADFLRNKANPAK